MRKYLIAIAMVLALGMNTEAVAQKHRHTPRTEQVDTTKNSQNAIEAFSDTTAAAENADAEDDTYTTHRGSVTFSSRDAQDVKEVMDAVGDAFEPWILVSIVSVVVIFLLAPLLIIFVIFYFINRNRKERYKLAQMAIQNGQPIPEDILKEKQDEWDRSDYQSGLRQIFLGIGLAIFLGIAAGRIGFGIGALVFFIGLGKVVIARKSGQTEYNPHNDNTDQFNNPSNNINNE